jgi:transcriptional regulator with XRE-family HTH domain
MDKRDIVKHFFTEMRRCFMYSIFEDLLTKNGLRIADISRETGIPYSTFTDWKAGRYTPKIDKLSKIANFFNISVEELTGAKPISLSRYVTEEEYMLICAFREAPQYKQEAIKDLLGLLMDVVEEKNVSSGA